jgi:hypothetical protein
MLHFDTGEISFVRNGKTLQFGGQTREELRLIEEVAELPPATVKSILTNFAVFLASASGHGLTRITAMDIPHYAGYELS